MAYKCERCNKELTPEDEYEEFETHFFHTQCYIEGLVGAIITAPYPGDKDTTTG